MVDNRFPVFPDQDVDITDAASHPKRCPEEDSAYHLYSCELQTP
jgi:hypothetical protein